MISSIWTGVYFFAVALVLALLEIQIEGPHGWAERLPTWRWDSPAVRRWIGKPVTGYHVFLNLFIVLLLHLPAVVAGTSLAREGEILALYFLLCVFWDFLWFACNPHFGWKRLAPQHVWWFRGWWLGLPRAYFSGLLVSFALWTLTADPHARGPKALTWGILFAQFILLSAVALAMASLVRRRPAPAAAPEFRATE